MRRTHGWLLGALLALTLAGCAAKPATGQSWALPLKNETLLTDESGNILWRGPGEAVRTEAGGILVTAWKNGRPEQTLLNGEGRVLAKAGDWVQLDQLNENLVAVWQTEEWKLETPDGQTYRYQAALRCEDGSFLLRGEKGGGCVLLNAEGKLQWRGGSDDLWPVSGMPGWYERMAPGMSMLVCPEKGIQYNRFERMVGQRRALLRTETGWQVIDAESGEVLYEGERNWRLYLDGLKAEWKDGGMLLEDENGEPGAAWVNSWPESGEVRIYLADNGERAAVWDETGALLFENEGADWTEVVTEDRFLQGGDGLRMLDGAGNTLWRKEKYEAASLLHTGDEVLIQAVYAQGEREKIDLLSVDGETRAAGLDEVYDLQPAGAAVLKDGSAGVLDWDGRWLCRWDAEE